MKIIAAIFISIILLVGCAKGQGAVAIATPTEVVMTEPTWSPTETPSDSPRQDLTEAVINLPQDAYPPAMSVPSITPLPSDYPPPRVVDNTYNPAPTPTLLTPLEAVRKAWDECKNSEIPPEIADFQNTKLSGLIFVYNNNKWRIGVDGRPVLTNCLASSGISPDGGWDVFRLNDALWLIERGTGEVQPIASGQERFASSPVWSPNEKYVYYAEANTEFEDADIWVLHVDTGKSHPLTDTPDVHEAPVSIWPAYPNWLLFISRPRDLLNEPDTIGYLSIMRTDGSGEQRLNESPVPSFDFSPDGKTLAYRDFSGAWLLRPGESPKPFLPEQFSIENWKIKSLSRPGWSPDGTKIAWFASGENSTGEYSGAAVFDLVENKAWFVHPFIHIGMGGSPFFFEWDPSSAWLAMGIPDQDPSKQGNWVARYDGSEEYHNGTQTFGINWGPEGDQLLYKDASDRKTYLKRVGSWTAAEINLPYEAYVLLWE